MSYHSDVILLCAESDARPEILAAIRHYFAERHERAAWVADAFVTGPMERTAVLLACVNYLDTDALVAHLRTLDWEWGESVQLCERTQHSDRFYIVDVFTPEEADAAWMERERRRADTPPPPTPRAARPGTED